MTLCISADNERITGGVFAKDGKLFAAFRVGCDRNKTSDEYSALFRTVLRLKGVEISDIKGAALSSVVPSLTSVLKSALFELTASQPVAVGAGIKTGVSIRTDNPSELGGDLVCLAAAALSKKAFPAVIVSVGAAVTFVAVDGSKNLIGCAIAPGISTSLSALSKSAELLTSVDMGKNPPSAIGKNTENSLLSLKPRSFSDALIANQSRYHLEYCNNVTNTAGRRVRGFLGIEVLVRSNMSVFSGDSLRTCVPEDVPEEWRR